MSAHGTVLLLPLPLPLAPHPLALESSLTNSSGSRELITTILHQEDQPPVRFSNLCTPPASTSSSRPRISSAPLPLLPSPGLPSSPPPPSSSFCVYQGRRAGGGRGGGFAGWIQIWKLGKEMCASGGFRATQRQQPAASSSSSQRQESWGASMADD